MKTKRPRILYFVPELPALNSGLLHAQVLTPASFMKQNGFDCFFIGTEVSSDKARQAQQMIVKNYQLDCRIIENSPIGIPYFGFRLTAIKTLLRTRKLIKEYAPDFIYTRAYHVAPTTRHIAGQNNALSVYDFRGVAAEESALKNGHGLIYRFLLAKELSALRKADRISCVSHKLKIWISENTGRSDAIVIPCCVDIEKFAIDIAARVEIRKQFNIAENSKLICYCGNVAKWQKTELIVNLFGEITRRRTDFKFLFITQNDREFKEIALRNQLPESCYYVVQSSHKEVPRLLSAADAGIIMRDDNVVNNVASPIKIGEYLACGLPVILTRGIGDYSEQIAKADIGLLLDTSKDQAQQVIEFMDKPDFQAMRTKVSSFAKQYVSLNSYLQNFKELFNNHR